MSSFVRNLVLRAAGVAPVAAPLKPPPAFEEPTELLEEPVAKTTAEQAAEPAASQAKMDAEKAVEPAKVREAQPVVPAAKARSVDSPMPAPVVPVEVSRTNMIEPRPATNTIAAAVRELRTEPGHSVAPAEAGLAQPTLPSQGSLEPAPPKGIELEPAPKPAPAVAPVREREIVFVDAPPLPPHILRQVEERVTQSVPAEAARVDVHIGRVEIVQPAAPPPPVVRQRREPRGFADHRAERTYLNRRWY